MPNLSGWLECCAQTYEEEAAILLWKACVLGIFLSYKATDLCPSILLCALRALAFLRQDAFSDPNTMRTHFQQAVASQGSPNFISSFF